MSDQALDLKKEYFSTLREEIKATKARIFTLLLVGVVGGPLLTLVCAATDYRILHLVAPIAVLIVLVLYLSEQTMLMRAGSYIRQTIEADEADWEHWVGGHKLRSAETQLFAMVMVVSLFFYVVLTFIAMDSLMSMDPIKEDMKVYSFYFWKYGVSAFYTLATLWALSTMFRFWRAATKTSVE